jgi:hypothetical protein
MGKIGCGKETARIDKARNRFTEIANVESAAIHCFTFVYQTDGRSKEKMVHALNRLVPERREEAKSNK